MRYPDIPRTRATGTRGLRAKDAFLRELVLGPTVTRDPAGRAERLGFRTSAVLELHHASFARSTPCASSWFEEHPCTSE